MKAPAKAVAALRIGVRVEYMVASLFVVEPDHRVHATYIAGSVPNWNYCLFSVSLLAASQEKPGNSRRDLGIFTYPRSRDALPTAVASAARVPAAPRTAASARLGLC